MTSTQNPQTDTSHNEEIVNDVHTDQVQDSSGGTWSGAASSSDADIIAGLQASLARAQADYQNLLMRVERDKSETVHFLSAKILLPLLTQIDNLERAVKLKEWVEWDAFVDGIRSVFGGFQKYLESQGVKSFDSIGQEVDPDRHDVMTEMPWESGKILQEFEKGYILREQILRHAKVVVGNGNI